MFNKLCLITSFYVYKFVSFLFSDELSFPGGECELFEIIRQPETVLQDPSRPDSEVYAHTRLDETSARLTVSQMTSSGRPRTIWSSFQARLVGIHVG